MNRIGFFPSISPIQILRGFFLFYFFCSACFSLSLQAISSISISIKKNPISHVPKRSSSQIGLINCPQSNCAHSHFYAHQLTVQCESLLQSTFDITVSKWSANIIYISSERLHGMELRIQSLSKRTVSCLEAMLKQKDGNDKITTNTHTHLIAFAYVISINSYCNSIGDIRRRKPLSIITK